jgi:hypothetical protein
MFRSLNRFGQVTVRKRIYPLVPPSEGCRPPDGYEAASVRQQSQLRRERPSQLGQGFDSARPTLKSR